MLKLSIDSGIMDLLRVSIFINKIELKIKERLSKFRVFCTNISKKYSDDVKNQLEVETSLKISVNSKVFRGGFSQIAIK